MNTPQVGQVIIVDHGNSKRRWRVTTVWTPYRDGTVPTYGVEVTKGGSDRTRFGQRVREMYIGTLSAAAWEVAQ